MELGVIGLGRMGANMAQRLIRHGHRVVGFDPGPEAVARLAATGGTPAESPGALVDLLAAPRAIWLMVPAGAAVDEAIDAVAPRLAPGDAIVDGGNSNYKDTQSRARRLAELRIDFVDVGTSGGVWGLENGYSLMIGGEAGAVGRLRPIFEALAPAVDQGWGHVGPSGAGHFAKMVHNGIEYGLMQAYAEGFAILRGKQDLGLDLHQVAEIWRHGSVVRSWLLDLVAAALRENSRLDGIDPYVPDSGEGRWTVAEAIDLDIAAPVITLALLQRLRSRDADSYSDRLLAALRGEFGGHAVRRE